MSRFVLHPLGQQHAMPEEIVGFNRGVFYTRSGKKLLYIPLEKIRIVKDDVAAHLHGCVPWCAQPSMVVTGCPCE